MTDNAQTGATTRAAPRGTPHVVCRADELPVGSRTIVELEGRSIGVFNVDGRLHALMNYCPHHGAPLCAGIVKGTMADTPPHEYQYGQHNEWIVCPWHGYEYRLETGRPLVKNERGRVRVYDVEERDGNVVVYV